MKTLTNQHKQRGYSMVEVLAYIAIYGTISYAILAGVSFFMNESSTKKSIAEVKALEKEIRSLSAPLSGFDVSASNTIITENANSLQEYLCIKGLSTFKTAAVCASAAPKTSSGTAFTILSPGIATASIPFSFGIEFPELSKFECTKFTEENWGPNIATTKVNSTFSYDGSYDSELSGKDVCTESTNSFTLYYR